jgi:tetratricopeptide (TPR) repeat protein
LDHPSRAELAAFCSEGLSLEREDEILQHLAFERCPECLAWVPLALRELICSADPPTSGEEAAYDAAIDRACEAVLREERRRLDLQAQEHRALKALKAGREFPKDVEDLARMRAQLTLSWQFRFDDPQRMLDLAWGAAQTSLRLDRRLYGSAQVFDYQAQAQAELGNAHRVADRLPEAEQALAHARQLFEQGTRSDLLEVRLLELEASLLADFRKFVPATAKLRKVLKFYTDGEDFHRVGRTLIKLGVYTGYAGNHEVAINWLRESLKLINPDSDPSLAFAAAQGLIFFLVESGRIKEAKKLRILYSRYLSSGGRIGQIKVRLLEGRIDAGLGNYQRAEAIFREVIEGFEELRLPIVAGIEKLDLAAVLLQQGKRQQAATPIAEAAAIFIAHRIPREAIGAVIMLRDSFQMGSGTLKMVQEVAVFLRQLEIEPALRFEARAWTPT